MSLPAAEAMPVVAEIPQIGFGEELRNHLGMGAAYIRDGFNSLRDRFDGRVQQVAAVALVASVSMVACGRGGSETTANLNAQPAAVSADLLSKLNPQNVQAHCAALADKFQLETFDRGDGSRGVSLRLESEGEVGKPGGRLWSDAIGTPMQNTGDAYLASREKAAVDCADPLQGVGTLVFLARQKVGDTKIADINERLKPFDVDDSEIDDIAATYMPLLGETRDAANVPDAEVSAALAKQAEYQRLADLGSQIIANFSPKGVVRSSATHTQHLAKGGLKTGAKGLKVTEETDEKDGMFVELDLTDKGQECAPLRIGINVGVNGKVNGGDKRMALLPSECEETPETTAPAATVPASTVVVTPTTGNTATTLGDTEEGPTTTKPGPTTTKPGPTTTKPGPTTTKPGPTTTTEGPTTTKPGPTTTKPGPTTTVGNTTTSVEFKDHTESPVGSDRNDPDQRDRPNVPVEPVRPVPPLPIETVPGRVDSGPGEVNTSVPPVTAAPPASTPPGQVNAPLPGNAPVPVR